MTHWQRPVGWQRPTVWCSPDSGSPAGFDRRCREIIRSERPCYFSPQVRYALDLARLELNMHMSDIIDAAVIDYLLAQGLQVEGLTDS